MIKYPHSQKLSPIVFLIIVQITLQVAGCSKSLAPNSEMISDNEPQLSASMSDAQVLGALKLDISKMKKEESLGPDGSSIYYSDGENLICITHSTWSGYVVTRMEPKTQFKVWELSKSKRSK